MKIWPPHLFFSSPAKCPFFPLFFSLSPVPRPVCSALCSWSLSHFHHRDLAFHLLHHADFDDLLFSDDFHYPSSTCLRWEVRDLPLDFFFRLSPPRSGSRDGVFLILLHSLGRQGVRGKIWREMEGAVWRRDWFCICLREDRLSLSLGLSLQLSMGLTYGHYTCLWNMWLCFDRYLFQSYPLDVNDILKIVCPHYTTPSPSPLRGHGCWQGNFVYSLIDNTSLYSKGCYKHPT